VTPITSWTKWFPTPPRDATTPGGRRRHDTVEGYAISSWELGYGDFVLRPDLSTLRRVPWHDNTALCVADVLTLDGAEVAPSPRQILRAQLGAWPIGVSRRSSHRARVHRLSRHLRGGLDQGVPGSHPVNQYNVDYSLLGTARVEPLLRRIRLDMAAAGMSWSRPRGVQLRPTRDRLPLRRGVGQADEHVLFKTGPRRLPPSRGTASRSWRSSTSVRATRATSTSRCGTWTVVRPSMPGARRRARHVRTFQHALAGMLATLRESTLFLAPTSTATSGS